MAISASSVSLLASVSCFHYCHCQRRSSMESTFWRDFASLKAYPGLYPGGCCHFSYIHSFLPRRGIKLSLLSRKKLGNYPISQKLRQLQTATASGVLFGGLNGSVAKEALSRKFRVNAEVEIASAIDVMNDLGFDTLTFLAVTVVVVPAFRIIKASPILGFFFAGVVLNQFGLIRNLTDVKILSEWGILFLLFEMGLELSLARLKALAKFAFGMGLTQVVLSTLAFTAFELPPNGAIGTKILEFLFHSRSDLVRTIYQLFGC
ncbi:K(+) efflux antiporter 3 [Nymphaea thermarum]|nr:K(+) efflux antiporter 3 [Nymphaea thermarum]